VFAGTLITHQNDGSVLSCCFANCRLQCSADAQHAAAAWARATSGQQLGQQPSGQVRAHGLQYVIIMLSSSCYQSSHSINAIDPCNTSLAHMWLSLRSHTAVLPYAAVASSMSAVTADHHRAWCCVDADAACRVGPLATPHTFEDDPDSRVLWHIGLQASLLLSVDVPEHKSV
jgi:hypothetical protein